MKGRRVSSMKLQVLLRTTRAINNAYPPKGLATVWLSVWPELFVSMWLTIPQLSGSASTQLSHREDAMLYR